MKLIRITKAQVAKITSALNGQQRYTCPLCKGKMTSRSKKDPCLDHDHGTGYLRDVLCRNCNGIEGKVFNLARRAKYGLTEREWLQNLVKYWERHETPQHGGILHHTHKTEEEKRLARNAKARRKRAAAKGK